MVAFGSVRSTNGVYDRNDGGQTTAPNFATTVRQRVQLQAAARVLIRHNRQVPI